MSAKANVEGLDADSATVLGHMADMINEGKDLTSTGKPEAPALSELAGVHVSADERDALMDRIEFAPEDPPPEEEQGSPAEARAKGKKKGRKELLDDLIELSRPPRRNQTHLRPADHQLLTDIHNGLLELKASK